MKSGAAAMTSFGTPGATGAACPDNGIAVSPKNAIIAAVIAARICVSG